MITRVDVTGYVRSGAIHVESIIGGNVHGGGALLDHESARRFPGAAQAVGIGPAASGLDHALALYAATAHHVVEVVAAVNATTVHVEGDGLVAGLVRHTLGGAQAGSYDETDTVVDTTGSPEAIQRLLHSLPELGALLAAGAAMPKRPKVDLYQMVHRRGVSVIGVREPLDRIADVQNLSRLAQQHAQMIQLAKRHGVNAALQEPTPLKGWWYLFLP